jgi:hypothetical protein
MIDDEIQAEGFTRRYVNGFLHRRSRRLPDMIDAIRHRWADEADYTVSKMKRVNLRRVA